MKMRAFSLSLVYASLVCLGMATKAKAQNNGFWWHHLFTQAGRNDAILRTAQAYPDVALYTGNGECKGWVQTVVWKASQGVVWPPMNDPWNLHRWVASPDVRVVASDQFVPWNSFRPGQIIQAQIGATTPHTMIVVTTSPFSISVIDCNWSKDLRIKRRQVDWATFNRQVTRFSLYEIK